jgi:parallel beta-helix repeat protein
LVKFILSERKPFITGLIRIFITINIVIIITIISQVEALADTIYVPDDYSTIQAAVDAASSGDTIIVRDGTYTENVDVNKDHLTIKSENGAEVTVVQAANSDDHVFEVTADYVNISGFTVKCATEYQKAGICLNGIASDNVEQCSILENIISGSHTGILLQYSSNNAITGNIADSNYYYGIYLLYSSDNSLTNNIASNGTYYGISLFGSSNNILTNNTVDLNANGIELSESSNNNTIANNAIDSNNNYGIPIISSCNNTLTNNTVSNNGYYGIMLSNSPNHTLRNNMMSENSFNFGVYGGLSDFIQDIDTSNRVNGKPIYYLLSEEYQQVPSDAGYVGIVSCTNITVTGVNIANNGQGIMLVDSSDSIVENVTVSNNDFGIYLFESSDNDINNSTVSNNGHGILFNTHSSDNTLDNNIISNNSSNGIYLADGSYSSNNIISNSIIINNSGFGIYLGTYTYSNTLTGNTVSNHYRGIYLYYSSDNTISNNTVNLNHQAGILLSSCSGNTFTTNIISNNSIGIWLTYISNNVIYFNSFVNNAENVRYSGDLINTWNSSELITYAYNGEIYENYLGNYWSDYSGSDVNPRDGIGDTPYSIDGDQDSYPLMGPFENYASTEDNPLPPQVDAFDVNPPSVPLGQVFAISYSVSDNVGLAWVELWRTLDSNGQPDGSKWEKLSTKYISGTSYSGSFFDIPLYPGGYWYGIHVGDTAGNLVTEKTPISVSVTVEGAYISEITPDSGVSGENVTITGVNFNKVLEKVINVIFKKGGNVGSAHVISTSDKEIICLVPVLAPIQTEDTSVEVALGGWSDNPVSNTVKFTYKKPVLESLNPPFGTIEEDITLSGKNFGYEQVGTSLPSSWVSPPRSYVTFGVTRIDEVVSWTNNTVLIKPPSDYGLGLGDAKEILKALEYIAAFGEKSGEKVFKKLFKTTAKNLIEEFFPELEGTIELEENEPLWSQYLKIFGAIGTEVIPGFSMVVDVNLIPKFDLPVTVTTTGGESNASLFQFIGKSPSQIDIEDSLIADLASPGELRVYDSHGRVTGLVNGGVKEEIPNSLYNDGIIMIFSPSDSYHYEVVGTDKGTYGLDIASIEDGKAATFTATDIPTISRAMHQYTIDWHALSEGGEGVTVQVDSDGDGKFEDTFTSDDELTQDDFLEETSPSPSPAPSPAVILGDFGSANNGPPDCKVDFEDLMIFAMAYGSTSDDDNWNLICDIAGPGGSLTPDGVIDFEDLMIFAMQYGKTCAGQ